MGETASEILIKKKKNVLRSFKLDIKFTSRGANAYNFNLHKHTGAIYHIYEKQPVSV